MLHPVSVSVKLCDSRCRINSCPACGSENNSHRANLKYSSTLKKWGIEKQLVHGELFFDPDCIEVDILECLDCSLKFVPKTSFEMVQSIETSEIFSKVVGRNYFAYAQPYIDEKFVDRVRCSDPSELTFAEARFRFVTDILSLHSSKESCHREKAVLDLGAAYGSLSQFIQIAFSRECKVLACELNPLSSREIKRRYPELPVLTLPIERIHSREDFSFIYCSDVIEHVWNLDTFLNSIARVLTNDGMVLFFTPDGDCKSARVAKYDWWGYIVPHHCQIFNRFNLSKLLVKHGFEIIRHGTQGEEFYILAKLSDTKRTIFF